MINQRNERNDGEDQNVRKLLDKWHVFCVREKSHLVIAGGYMTMPVWHNSTLMATVYGAAALMVTHKIYRDGQAETTELKHEPRHLARD